MKLYNTLNKKVEEFVPHEEGIVRLYTCGPTVYHYAHIGNLRTYISEDVLEKGLEYLGYDVRRVMNITDVGHMTSDADTGDDKMQVAAKRENKSAVDIAKFYTEAFQKDCEKLNIRWPVVVSNATDNIDMYIKMIQKLLDNGYAYQADGNVYFDTSKMPNYYELSGRKSDELLLAVRDSVEVDSAKKNPFDFGLWFTKSKFDSQELKWDSPWGIGYPGWHIECSGIAIKYLGEYLDIHCGAEDAVFPHHTNEIAQSEAYLGHKWCNYWVHLGFLNDSTGKMSKSKGEFLTVSLLEEKGYDPIVYRFMCLNSYYRKQLVFSFEALDQAASTYQKLKNKIKQLDRTPDLHESKLDYYQNKFKEAIGNDLNTSSMITILYEVLKDDELSDFTKLYLIDDFDKVLSLNLIDYEQAEDNIDEDFEKFVQEEISKRNEAKKNKDFATADKIRDELLEKGIKLVDTREGTTYERV